MHSVQDHPDVHLPGMHHPLLTSDAEANPPRECAWEMGSSDSGSSSQCAMDQRSISDASHSRGPGSIASTYWRPERTDRNANLSAIDERCAGASMVRL